MDRSYVTDWFVALQSEFPSLIRLRIVVAAFWLLSELADYLPVFERDFYVTDMVISHPHKHSQIGGTLNHFIALLVPAAIVVTVGLYRLSFIALHHGVLALLAGRGMARFFTNMLKARVGRLRPDFLARCKWDDVAKKCTGKAADILDGKRSFPSGHSSAAFAGMTFLSFWLAGQTAAWCFHAPVPAASFRSSRLGRLSLTLVPLIWAAFVALTRLEDYRHHKEDVIAGGFIGIMCATISYLAFWPSPFNARNFASRVYGQPRLDTGEDRRREANAEFELERLEEDDMDV
ncbi:lipid phosphate phosphatase 1 [Mycena galericulata]|nr:lipid phosphate phosphatase 1 [Mycena galericulata]